MAETFHIAALQPELRWRQPMPNMLLLRKLVENLPAAVQCVLLPENWIGVPAGDPEIDQHFEQGTQFLRTLARACDVNVVGGSLVRCNSDGAFENVTPVVDRRGEPIGEYIKQALFGSEQDSHSAGAGRGIVELDGVKVGLLICADLWHHHLIEALRDDAEVVCVSTKTSVPSDLNVTYARALWHSLALTRAMETGLPLAVSDWPSARHSASDVDTSVGSIHSPGMNFDPGRLRRRPSQPGAQVPTATAPTSAEPALGGHVHYTAGAATICDPGQRPNMATVQRTIDRGEPGQLVQVIDLDAAERYRQYRQTVGLLRPLS